MKRMKIPVFISAALLAAAGLFLFSGCGAEPGLAEVSSVDQLLSAIGPNRTIQLAPGEYELSQACLQIGIRHTFLAVLPIGKNVVGHAVTVTTVFPVCLHNGLL